MTTTSRLLTVLLFAFTTANTFAQIPNSGFENWTTGCIPSTTYNITQSNESSTMMLYQDSSNTGSQKIYFSKYFSPNGDGIQDGSFVTGDSVAQILISIYDMCSKKLFETNLPYSGWAGTYYGKPVSKGIYKRSIQCQFINGVNFSINDSVQLILFTTIAVNLNYMQLNEWETPYPSDSFCCAVTKDTSHYPYSVGNYSVRMENKPSLSVYGGIEIEDFPITGHPSSLTGYYKFAPQNGDTMSIVVVLSDSTGTPVSVSIDTSTISTPNWTSFNIPFSNYTTADIVSIFIYAGANGNSVLNVDNLNFDSLITEQLTSTDFKMIPFYN